MTSETRMTGLRNAGRKAPAATMAWQIAYPASTLLYVVSRLPKSSPLSLLLSRTYRKMAKKAISVKT